MNAPIEAKTIVRENADFTVKWNHDGTLASLVLNDDPDRMNWIEGTAGWGQLRLVAQYPVRPWQNSTAFRFKGMRQDGEWVVSSYEMDQWETLRAEVRRRVTDEALEEEYVFVNDATWPIYFRRGDLGILATFNDSYGDAAECVVRRCHAHIWCGGENSWGHALKMGPFPTELALVLQKGDLDAYSVRRRWKELSNDRGDFELHPAAFVLKGGESKTFAWKVVAHPAGKFDEALLRLGGAKIDFRQETIFPDETFEIDVSAPDGTARHYSRKPESGVGEYVFEFEAGGKKAKAIGYCSPSLEELLDRRIHFIVRNQTSLNSSWSTPTPCAASTATNPTTSAKKSPSATGTATGSGATGCSATPCTSTAPFRRGPSCSAPPSPGTRHGGRGPSGASETASSCSSPMARRRRPGCFPSRRPCSAKTAKTWGRASSAKAPTPS